MIEALAFGLGVLGVLALTHRGASVSDKRIAAVLAVNFALYLAGQMFTGNAAPWLWFLAADAACAWFILHPPASRTAAWVGSVYVLLLIIHVAFAASGSLAVGLYLDLCAAGGWLQLVILTTGAINGRRRKVATYGSRGGAVKGASASHQESLG